MSTEEECDAVVRWNILFLHFFSPFPNICSFFFLSFSFYHYYYYSHIYSIPLYLYLRVSRDVVLSLFAGRGERSFGRSNKKKKKKSIHSSRMEKRYEKGSGMVYRLVRRRRDFEYLVAMATGANYFSVFRPCERRPTSSSLFLSLSLPLFLDLRPGFLSTGRRGATFLPLCRILSGTPTPFVVHTRQPFAKHWIIRFSSLARC